MKGTESRLYGTNITPGCHPGDSHHRNRRVGFSLPRVAKCPARSRTIPAGRINKSVVAESLSTRTLLRNRSPRDEAAVHSGSSGVEIRIKNAMVPIVALCIFPAFGHSPGCEGKPRVAGQSFAVHGRETFWNATPALQRWRIGTNRNVERRMICVAWPGHWRFATSHGYGWCLGRPAFVRRKSRKMPGL
jgi:hypothetical protein